MNRHQYRGPFRSCFVSTDTTQTIRRITRLSIESPRALSSLILTPQDSHEVVSLSIHHSLKRLHVFVPLVLFITLPWWPFFSDGSCYVWLLTLWGEIFCPIQHVRLILLIHAISVAESLLTVLWINGSGETCLPHFSIVLLSRLLTTISLKDPVVLATAFLAPVGLKSAVPTPYLHLR